MKSRILPMMIVAFVLAAPLHAFADEALAQAYDPNFDGNHAHSQNDFVRTGSSTDRRTTAQITKDEQAMVDARTRDGSKPKNVPPPEGKPTGSGVESKPPEPNKWFLLSLAQTTLCGAAVGILIGALFGPVGMIAGALIGAALFYGLSQ